MFIRFIIAATYTSMADIGYDTTMERVEINGCTQYKILADGEWWVTRRVLSSVRAEVIVGRGTRVWEVCRWDQRNDPNPPTKALKDFWPERETPSEKKTRDTIVSKFNEVNDVGDISDAHEYFMTIQSDEIVLQDGEQDATEDQACYTLYWPDYDNYDREVQHAGPYRRWWWDPIGGWYAGPPRSYILPLRSYHGKFHRRILFNEVGITLDSFLRDHPAYFGALIDVVKGWCAEFT